MEPWENEPDVLRFRSHGLKCIIVRQSEMGHLCGYVQLPHSRLRDKAVRKNRRITRGHKNYAYDLRAFSDIEVHGGLTFCRQSGHYLMKGKMWLGFDCAHWDDVKPGLFKTLRAIGSDGGVFEGSSYKTIGYVRKETERLAEQVIQILEAEK